MLPPPYPNNPFGYANAEVPYNVAGAFVAWGWIRSLFNTAMPGLLSEVEAMAHVAPGRYM